jgi:hypothetical protein
MRRTTLISLLLAATALTGCDMFGESADKLAANKEAEGRAIGGACRHAGRAIEDCYALNKKADKASVFAGWRDMNDYMRENKIEDVPPVGRASRLEPKSAEPTVEAKAATDPATEAAATEKRPSRSGAGGKVREPKGQD